ncbi:hypothetical protein MOC47_09980 [Bacillus spizizenii]|uniref:Uncharacterized protein n=1 Tax=Bacillus spizizenii TaxID=96241 RepID=A0A9Q4DR46_BACSC|nr:hypothetical protein [Bacillus spizizenii]MDU7576179.1 hypothetical protein [Bacillus subtilis]MCY7796310.1 hypothetical protein [Bacillus spizizenii]MCY7809166.1 hypothetical protein [Bacillus spizizenii]MCY7822428.1 hypothetical protein [Bacillus spizizenii]MCY7852427.1 hypothetical protein [Bacillus spizizenii]
MYHYYYGPALIPYFTHNLNTQKNPDFSERQRRREITLNVDGIIPPSSSEDLGDSFYSFAWTGQQVIDPGEYLVCHLEGRDIKVVNAGFAPRDTAPLYAIASFPRRRNQWVIIIHNPVQTQRAISLYLIAKR